jgi:hypothetical protein
MAQTVINTAAITANTSTSQVIGAGVAATFTIYPASGSLDVTQQANLFFDTPGGDVPVPGGELNIRTPIIQVQGPATIICVKGAAAASFGVVLDT